MADRAGDARGRRADDPRALSRCRGGRRPAGRRHRRRAFRPARLSRPPLHADDSGVVGAGLRSRTAIDWHRDPVHGRVAPALFWSEVPYLDPACGDHKIIWELNRHQHFLALGRAWWLAGHRPARATFVRHLASWMDANPPLVGINWASMLELALRSLSWIWALEFFVEPAAGADGPTASRPTRTRGSSTCCSASIASCSSSSRTCRPTSAPTPICSAKPWRLYVAGRALPELRRAPALGRARTPRPDRGDVAPDQPRWRPRRAIVPLPPLHARLLPAGARGGAADRRRHAALRRSGAAAGPLRADHRRRSRTPGPDRRRRRRPAVPDLRPRQRRRQRLAGAGRLAARRSVARRGTGARGGGVDVGRAPPRSRTTGRTAVPDRRRRRSATAATPSAAPGAAITSCSTPGRTAI